MLDSTDVASQGYCFQVDLAWQTWQAGFRVVEVPITFVERERGESKMSRAIVVEALWRVTVWGLTSRRSGPDRKEAEPCRSPLLLFIVVPAVEIYVLIQVGQVIGALPTVALLVLDAVAGRLAVQARGAQGLAGAHHGDRRARVPAREVADGALVVLGGAFLLTPGFVTDIVGVLCLLPPTRALLRRALTGFVTRRMLLPGTGPGSPARPYLGSGVDRVVDGRSSTATRWPRGQADASGGLHPVALGLAVGLELGLDLALVLVQDREALGEDLFELGDAAALQQHVPVRADRLHGLGLGRLGVAAQRGATADPALPGERDVGLSGERDGRLVPVRAVVGREGARRELGVPVALVADRSEAAASQNAVTHGGLPCRAELVGVFFVGDVHVLVMPIVADGTTFADSTTRTDVKTLQRAQRPDPYRDSPSAPQAHPSSPGEL